MHRFLVAFTTAIHLLAAMSARAQDIPTDETGFTTYVAERMRAVIGDVPVRIKAPLTLSIGSLQANLDRIFLFCKRNDAGCTKEIDTYVKAAADTSRNQNAPPTRKGIRVVVRAADYIRQAQRELSPSALVPAKPLVEGLVLVPVLDSPRAVRMITEKDSAALGLTTNQVYEIAVANVRNSTKPLTEVAKAVGQGQIGRLAGDFYQPSRLAFVESWAPLAEAQSGVLIVAVPATDTLFYIGDDSPIAVDALRTLVKNVTGRAPNPLSNILLRWTPKGWQVVR